MQELTTSAVVIPFEVAVEVVNPASGVDGPLLPMLDAVSELEE